MYAVDKDSGQYKAPMNVLFNEDRVFTPADTAVITPNSDTPYSMLWLDLRTEPVVISVPAVPKGRYYSVQLIDGNTYNYGYIGSRSTGTSAGIAFDFAVVNYALRVGFINPLRKPGLGVEIDEERVIEASKNPPDWRNPVWRHADGSVAEW